MRCRVKWGDAYSDEFEVPLGTKQGGISSPKYFSVYVDDMVKLLRSCGYGCHLIKTFVGCILFADDLALIGPSRTALQKMINICHDYCSKFCLEFNAAKSKVLVFGKSRNMAMAPLYIGNSPMESVDEWKYLGTTIVAGKLLSFSARADLSSFFRAANAVINTLTGAHEHTLVTLLYSNCVPILT